MVGAGASLATGARLLPALLFWRGGWSDSGTPDVATPAIVRLTYQGGGLPPGSPPPEGQLAIVRKVPGEPPTLPYI